MRKTFRVKSGADVEEVKVPDPIDIYREYHVEPTPRSDGEFQMPEKEIQTFKDHRVEPLPIDEVHAKVPEKMGVMPFEEHNVELSPIGEIHAKVPEEEGIVPYKSVSPETSGVIREEKLREEVLEESSKPSDSTAESTGKDGEGIMISQQWRNPGCAGIPYGYLLPGEYHIVEREVYDIDEYLKDHELTPDTNVCVYDAEGNELHVVYRKKEEPIPEYEEEPMGESEEEQPSGRPQEEEGEKGPGPTPIPEPGPEPSTPPEESGRPGGVPEVPPVSVPEEEVGIEEGGFIINDEVFYSIDRIDEYLEGAEGLTDYELFEVELRLYSQEFKQWSYELSGPKSINEIRSSPDYKEDKISEFKYDGRLFGSRFLGRIFGSETKSDEEVEEEQKTYTVRKYDSEAREWKDREVKIYDVDAKIESSKNNKSLYDMWEEEKRKVVSSRSDKKMPSHGDLTDMMKTLYTNLDTDGRVNKYDEYMETYVGKDYTPSEWIEHGDLSDSFWGGIKKWFGRRNRKQLGNFGTYN